MILAFFRYFWNPVTGDHGALPNANAPPRVSGDKTQQRLEEEAWQQRLRDQERVRKKEQEEEREFLWMWLLSAECRRAHQELMANLQDAMIAVRLSHKEALAREQLAQAALLELQGKAIVLPDGRRVYFTRDGTRLYGEDGHEIMDGHNIRAAFESHREKPDAPSYEEFVEHRNARDRATENTQRLESALHRLHALTEKTETGKLSPQEIKAIQEETQDILNGLPAEARERYERRRQSRTGDAGVSYRAVDPDFESLPVMHADFRQAASAPPPEKVADVNDKPASAPAYKAAPPF
jgi:hypothetical protein